MQIDTIKQKKKSAQDRRNEKHDNEIEGASSKLLGKYGHKPQGHEFKAFKMDEKRLKLNKQPEGANLYKCIRGFLPGHVSDKTYYKAVVCGRENCPVCGLDYSIAHNRRVNRAFGRITQIENVGYMVITIPEQLRQAFNNKEVLNKFRSYIRRKLKNGTTVYINARNKKTGELIKTPIAKTDFSQGLMRWHWAGDDLKTWKPHLNILLDAKFITPGLLEQFRQDIINWFKYWFGGNYPGNIYYAYTNKPAKVKHWLKYILRSTALNITDADTIETIFKYRNTSYFGKFEKAKIERDQATAIMAGCDPDTGEVIQWQKRINPGQFYTENKGKYQKVLIEAKPGEPPIDLGIYVVLKYPLPLPDK